MSDAMSISEVNKNRRYTYADYLEWEGPQRYQLFDGEAVMMASPSVTHQALLRELLVEFTVFLRNKPCQVYGAPLDVRLFPQKDKSDKTVLQPDLLVVCDKGKLSKGSVDGSPDLVIEIMSPSNSHRELLLKFNYYLEAGVREYWVIDPEIKQVHVHVYEKGHFMSATYKENARIAVSILPGLEISLESLWVRSEVS